MAKLPNTEEELCKEDFYSLATERKLEEANILLQLAEQSLDHNIQLTEVFFNAFVNSIRAVSLHLKAELIRLEKGGYVDNALAWYNESMKSFGAKDIAKLFIDLRNESEKSSVLESVTQMIVIDGRLRNIDITIDWRNKRFKKYESNFGEEGLLKLSRIYYQLMFELIEEAKKKFGFKDIPDRGFRGHSTYIRSSVKNELNKHLKSLI